MSSQQTDNDPLGFHYKVRLRVMSLKDRTEVKVLDCYAGEGKVWAAVQEKVDCKIIVTRIEMKKGMLGLYLCGDNRKFLKTLDLSQYDIIDLDAYGVPFQQLEIILRRGYRGIVHGTFIQTGFGKLPSGLLTSLGYSARMVKKCPTIFTRNGFDKWCKWLKIKGLRAILYLQIGRKFYFYINCTEINQ